MPATLPFPDAGSARDALAFARRAARIGDDGIHLVAADGVLAMSAPALLPRSVLDRTPFILALRTLAIDPELRCDFTVAALAPADGNRLALPDVALAPAWADAPIPRGGWAGERTVACSTLETIAEQGIAAIAAALPDQPGLDVVQKARAAVWGEPEAALGGLPRGVAFAAAAFGLLGRNAGDARILQSGRWTRIALPGGHVLLRGPAVSGLTPVRPTGRRPD